METVMKYLARRAAQYASHYPVAVRPAFAAGPLLALIACCLIAAVALLLAWGPSVAFAEAVAQAPVADSATGGLISLWGPFLGVISALVIFFDRVAKVIPNGTTSAVLQGIRVVATVLGAKVQDRQ
jgi:hypothetical protein